MNKTYYLLRFLIIISFIALVVFLYGFITEVNIGHPVLYILLTTALFFKILKVLFEWFHYINIPDSKPKNHSTSSVKHYSVDMLTTACPGEPFEMFEETLTAMVAVEYPHTTYLCDEGNDPQLIDLCNRLGVIHVTRATHENAKAGNVNNALKNATGEIVVILDPDHVPAPDFLDQVLPHFEDPKIGYVQVVQAYKNQAESFVARAAAEQTYNFYGPFMRAMGAYGSAQAIGANCTFRREALDSIGGHAPGLTEDMHTSMLLHAKGWKSKYVPVVISRGLVPSSLSAFYKQQLKWSRGTFDLWLNLYPKLFKKFTLPQKIHYGLMPVYYLFGLIVIIDIAVPIYSLLTGEYPWLLNPILFFSYFTPFLILSLIVRLSAQKYLHDPHERGLHFFGGILRVGSWWVFTVGFIYTLLNIRVPYIPTPKEHTSKNEFLLGLPNLFVAIISVAAGIYGLSRDWQPYSFLMATFAFSNATIFLLAFAIGQSKWVDAVRNYWLEIKKNSLVTKSKFDYHHINRLATPAIILILIVLSSFLLPISFTSKIEGIFEKREEARMDREVGGFYHGIYLSSYDSENEFEQLTDSEREFGHKWSVISTYLAWGDSLPTAHWNQIIDHKAIPMITWEPWTNLFEGYESIPDFNENKRVFHYILEGYFDSYIDTMAIELRSLDTPVFLRFAHEMQNPMYPWSTVGGNTPEEFVEAWKYVHKRFDKLGANNVSWIWSPWSTENLDAYFPYGHAGSITEYVDWIAITGLHYDMPDPSYKFYDFNSIYEPFKMEFDSLGLELPIMVAEFGSTSYQSKNTEWNVRALRDIEEKYPEIKSVVLFHSNRDSNWISDWRPGDAESIDWTFDLSQINQAFTTFDLANPEIYPQVVGDQGTRSTSIQGQNGNYQWKVNGQNYYVQGVSYNPGHDWQEGFFPLSRKQLEKDFGHIKNMGANTIRRYGKTIYDRNIITIAAEYDLNIIFGFWFDANVDYIKDSKKVENYRREVLESVRKNKNNKQIIAWNIGNETWGNLRKNFAQPYLTANRKAYVLFLEELAQEIHKMDSERPVISSERHERTRLPAVLNSFKTFAPSIDILGINVYYNANLQTLDSVYKEADLGKPYLVTEFGPKGYWNSRLGDFRNDTIPVEISSVKKGDYYKDQWENWISPYKGSNLGGVAYSWKDKYEGTATWFGISDYKGRLKPAYYSLKEAWVASQGEPNTFADISIVGYWYPRKAGESIWLDAAITNSFEGKLNYEWKVLEDGTWKEFSAITQLLDNGKKVQIKMPKTKSTYRVYLFAEDEYGNVVTASRPLVYQ